MKELFENTRPKLLILYDYFYPGFKAGGPIQSLTNLAIALENYYDISVITFAYDLHSKNSYKHIQLNSWNTINLPGSASPVNVWYAEKKKLNITKLKEIIQQKNPEIIYLNGIFSFNFFMLPLITIRQLSYKPKIIICPRGMLQQGALSGKYLKKKFYTSALKLTGLLKKTLWHATNKQEAGDITKTFGLKQQIIIASNIPKRPLLKIKFPQKQNGKLRLVYLSLIAEKKNLLFTLEVIKECSGVTLDIYGPVKDISYWKECEKLIKQLQDKVAYKGEVIPANVQDVFEKYDASILLTKGENFGHALYESLSAGRPVITSLFTPWQNLKQHKAGWNIDIASRSEAISTLNNLGDTSTEVFNEYCIGAHKMATDYFNNLNSVEEYRKLFSTS